MILLIDNYDSFSFNLYQLIGSIEPDIRVIRNDEMSVKDVDRLHPDAIVISPGPGRPEDAGICADLVKRLGSKYPVLGVCLGHQAICYAYGSEITYAKNLMHGKQSVVTVTDRDPMFEGLPDSFPVARYHSLVADPDRLSGDLVVTSVTKDGEIMSVRHRTDRVYGLQFHPESILTPDGKAMLDNFINRIVKGGGSE